VNPEGGKKKNRAAIVRPTNDIIKNPIWKRKQTNKEQKKKKNIQESTPYDQLLTNEWSSKRPNNRSFEQDKHAFILVSIVLPFCCRAAKTKKSTTDTHPLL
jgi:hypothetical protein